MLALGKYCRIGQGCVVRPGYKTYKGYVWILLTHPIGADSSTVLSAEYSGEHKPDHPYLMLAHARSMPIQLLSHEDRRIRLNWREFSSGSCYYWEYGSNREKLRYRGCSRALSLSGDVA